MPYGVYLSATGAAAQSSRMEALSHNLANVNTPGYKPQHTVMQARFAELIERGEVQSGLQGADDIGGGVTIAPQRTQFAPGPIEKTGSETDFAINDRESFFVLRRDGEQFLTRAGDFLFDSRGRMINQNGDQVLATDGQPIQIEPGLPYQVTQNGHVDQAGTRWQMMIAKPKSLGDLSHVGGNQFKPLADFDLVVGGDRDVVAGMLEKSAVSPTRAMMELIETSRVYEANIRMIQNQDSVMGTLINRVMK